MISPAWHKVLPTMFFLNILMMMLLLRRQLRRTLCTKTASYQAASTLNHLLFILHAQTHTGTLSFFFFFTFSHQCTWSFVAFNFQQVFSFFSQIYKKKKNSSFASHPISNTCAVNLHFLWAASAFILHTHHLVLGGAVELCTNKVGGYHNSHAGQATSLLGVKKKYFIPFFYMPQPVECFVICESLKISQLRLTNL